MTPLYGIACFCDIGFGARAVSRKTPIFFIDHLKKHRKLIGPDGFEKHRNDGDVRLETPKYPITPQKPLKKNPKTSKTHQKASKTPQNLKIR